MLNRLELKACIARRGMTQRSLAKAMGISERALSAKITAGRFTLDEFEAMVRVLDIEHPWETLITQKDGLLRTDHP